MKILLSIVTLLSFILCYDIKGANAQPDELLAQESEHNWVKYSTDYSEVETGTHEYPYWKNFMRYNRTCTITQIIKTVVHYCDMHDHTKSETYIEETVHSHQHRD